MTCQCCYSSQTKEGKCLISSVKRTGSKTKNLLVLAIRSSYISEEVYWSLRWLQKQRKHAIFLIIKINLGLSPNFNISKKDEEFWNWLRLIMSSHLHSHNTPLRHWLPVVSFYFIITSRSEDIDPVSHYKLNEEVVPLIFFDPDSIKIILEPHQNAMPNPKVSTLAHTLQHSSYDMVSIQTNKQFSNYHIITSSNF